MKPRIVLAVTALISFALLAFALYLQHVKLMLPCPLCVVQRYAFVAIGLFCLVGAIGNAPKPAASLGLLAALSGGGVAIRHIWIQAHPGVSCGIDPVETALNKMVTAEWLPSVFFANGECSTDYPAIIGLSIPQWALLWFVIVSLAMILVLLRRR
jgi:disulfide bond formation protein DsbB